MCVLSSHGTYFDTKYDLYDVIYGIKGDMINIETLVNAMNPEKCPTLANKPKLFLMQVSLLPQLYRHKMPVSSYLKVYITIQVQ